MSYIYLFIYYIKSPTMGNWKNKVMKTIETKYSRMDQVKFVEDRL